MGSLGESYDWGWKRRERYKLAIKLTIVLVSIVTIVFILL